ncbi:uncharacterized protein GGS22DRAFT_197088 [Annulohypoxylon maeteangense]|uniref:uncharacterized protein n=1 Tax=Annulohypoxylon maeteangense TaxID=1927788 RepID=UPI0020080B57|nr:uncharacterized protein GGS22DRAFT_197088 [Annulohypoxylon maeteangense]KAI0881377.1 hypothetical protein GGS22DRAFT_197088 [Annulohypoxylon maeteangense]
MDNARTGPQEMEALDLGESYFGPPPSQSQLHEPRKGLVLQAPNSRDVSHLIQKVPFVQRANPTIHEYHPRFQFMLRYFFSLLESTMLTLQEILERTFEPHEIRLLEPATAPSPLAKLQRDNSIRYQRILETRFKGQRQSLQLKLAILYFGLPVAPIHPGFPQLNLLRDLDFGEDKLTKITDPLEFLDDYSEKKYGEPGNRVKDPYFPQLCQTQEFPSMSLRGGASPAVIQEEDDALQPPANREMRVYGYQGSILADEEKLLYPRFVEAVDQILGVTSEINYNICLQIWDLSDIYNTRVVEEAKGFIRHTDAHLLQNDDLYTLLVRWFADNNGDGQYSCFVYFDKEEPPEACQPFYEVDRYLVRLWDASNARMAYMKVPDTLQPTHKPSHFHAEYLRAMRLLSPELPHGYLQFSDAGPITFGLFDPPPEVWTQIINDQSTGGELATLSFSVSPIPDDQVAVWVPGCHTYKNEFTPEKAESLPQTSGTIPKDYLNLSETDNDRLGIERILDDVLLSNPSLRENKDFAGLDLWVPGEGYLDTRTESRQVLFRNGKITVQALLDWWDILKGLRKSKIHSTENKSTIVARPTFSNYRFHSGQGVMEMEKLDGEENFRRFIEAIKAEFYRGHPYTKGGQVVHMTQTTWGLNTTDFVITPDTDEDGWNWIIRRITEPDITLSLESWDCDWPVKKETTWGPRYDGKGPDSQLSSRIEVPWIKNPHDKHMDAIFKDSVNNQKSAARAEELRKRLFWDTPSIFTNPVKPAIPIHGAPIENVVRTGPHVPGYTTAMRTPGEMARLQRETHRLRGNLLDRIRECPYNECQRYFPFRDREGLARHLKEDHKTLSCFLCNKDSHLLPYYDQTSLRRHFLDVHQQDIQDEIGHTIAKDSVVPAPAPAPVIADPRSSQSTEPTAANSGSSPDPATSPITKPPGQSSPDAQDTSPDHHGRPGRWDRQNSRVRVRQDDKRTVVTTTDPTIRKSPIRWKEAKPGDAIPPRRQPSPDWDILLEREAKDPLSFQPDPDWRCSRCLRPAGSDIIQAEWHMSKNGSCKIRRGLGSVEVNVLPNRSGWIIPKININFSKAFHDFVKRYPAYRKTMFPVRDKSVEQVYDRPYELGPELGSTKDDPNAPANIEHTRALDLPWPPYEGTTIPLNKPEIQREGEDELNLQVSALGSQTTGLINLGDLLEGGDALFPPRKRSKVVDPADLEDPFYRPPKTAEPEPSLSLETPGYESVTDLSSVTDELSIQSTDTEIMYLVRPKTKQPSVSGEESPADADTDISQPISENTPASQTDLITSDETSTGTETEYLPTVTEDSVSVNDNPRKRRRAGEIDPTYNLQLAGDDDNISEEFSEVSAVPDPVQNLEPDAPRTPKKSKTGRGRPRTGKKPVQPRSSGKKPTGFGRSVAQGGPFVSLPPDWKAAE